MARSRKIQSGKKTGELSTGHTVDALPIKQGALTLYSFVEKASRLWEFVSINRRKEDKKDGYQRVLSTSRVRSVADYIKDGNIVPGSIVIAIDSGKYSLTSGKLKMSAGKDIAWVIDGQHRLAGAYLASSEGKDIELSVIALLDFPLQSQIEQFVTINREGKNVPTSLYLDLLNLLPGTRTPGEVATERSADLANRLRHKKDSVFYGRIVVTTSPVRGQISIVQFVRTVTPYVNPERGLLNVNTLQDQADILENYFCAIKSVFAEEWNRPESIFFKTVGFGALMRIFDDIFKHTIQSGSFRISDIEKVLQPVKSFDFEQWRSKGSGNNAEMEAAKDFRVEFAVAMEKARASGRTGQIVLK